MQKKLIGMAVAGILAAPAFAQTSNVVVYGVANVGVDNYSATGSAAGSAGDYKSRSRLFDFGSRIGFKGKEGLGNGLYTRFQIESGVNMDTGNNLGQSGVPNDSAGYLGSRDTFLALGGHWGEVRAGRQSVYWTNGRTNLLAAIGIGMPVSIASGGGGMVGAPMHRISNVLKYVSPKFNGFNVNLSWIAAGEATNSAGTSAPGQDPNGKGYGLSLNYDNGPISAHYKYASLQASGSPEKDSAQKLILGYFYHGHSHVGLILIRNKHADVLHPVKWYDGSMLANVGDTLTQNMWNANWAGFFGPWELDAQYGQGASVNGMTGAAANSGETKFSEFQLAAQYHFSKRTHMYFEYGQITNKSQNWMDFAGGNMSSGIYPVNSTKTLGFISSASAGADPRIIGVGVRHTF